MRFENTIQNRLTGRHKRSLIFVGADNIKNKRILDIGCSYGWFEKWAIENGCNSIVGIEPDEKDFENAQKEVPTAKYLQGSALEIPLDDKSVNVVVMWEVLEHLPKNVEEKAFLEINRVLEERGEFYLSTPHSTFWSCILVPARWLVGHRHYSLKQFKRTAEKTGFEIEKVEYGGGFWELHSMILLYIFKWLFRREIPFKKWFEKKRGVEFLCEDGWTNIFVKLRKV
jgi:SAM-dependent methyltransferase